MYCQLHRNLTAVAIACALACSVASMVSAAPADNEPSLSDLVRITAVDGVLRFEWTGTHPAGVQSITARGPEANWRVRAPRETRGLVAGSLTLERPAGGTKEPRDFWFISIIATPDQVLISANRGGRIAHDTMLRLIQRGDRSVQLAVAEAGSGRSFSIHASNLVELRRKHPEQVRDYVVPLLRQIAGEDLLLPGAADVYRVFDEVVPEPRLAAEVDAIIPELSNPSFARRERASRELAALGPAATCAAMRVDRTMLNAEAAARLDELIENKARRRNGNPALMRNELSFLADCMEFDDPQIRRAAKSQIEQITGTRIPLLAVPTPKEWSAAADVIRQQVSKKIRI
jgi:hypothetical protein